MLNGKKVGLHLQNLEYSGEKNLFLIGEKGAGKSTFTKIMLGLYRDYHGSFLCNGVELKEISGGIPDKRVCLSAAGFSDSGI